VKIAQIKHKPSRRYKNVKNKNWEFKNIEYVASGNFGKVYKAKWNGNLVAFKKIKRESNTAEFKEEFERISTVQEHNNVIRVYKIIYNPARIIMEYIRNGDLLSYMKKVRNRIKNDMNIKIKWMIEICSGMRYMHENKIIHRDLALRNILLSVDLYCKISDFGLSRTLDSYQRQGCTCPQELPLRRYPPECVLNENGTEKDEIEYSVEVDIWSIGILYWEMFSLEIPYKNFRNPLNALKTINSGYRLSKPANCSNIDYNLMMSCWEKRASDRISLNIFKIGCSFMLCIYLRFDMHF